MEVNREIQVSAALALRKISLYQNNMEPGEPNSCLALKEKEK
jgi:hypothetical protein